MNLSDQSSSGVRPLFMGAGGRGLTKSGPSRPKAGKDPHWGNKRGALVNYGSEPLDELERGAPVLDGVERHLPVRLLDRGHNEPRLPLSGSIFVRLSRHRRPEPLTPRRRERWVEPRVIHSNTEEICHTKEKSARTIRLRAGARLPDGGGGWCEQQ